MTDRTGNQQPTVKTRRLEQFSEIIRLTQSMLALAEAGEWDAIAPVQAERQELILGFFDAGIAVEEAAWVERGINEILQLDKRVMAMGKDAIASISSDYELLTKSRNASNAYLANR